MTHADTPRTRSALFVDFDNTFSGLLQIDRRAAFDFVDNLDDWLDGLRALTTPSGARRDLLVCRAYLNPAGWIVDPERGNDNKRMWLGRFRAPLTNAGFEVVDCPPLTAGQKNAADIRMVIDVLDALAAPVTYDEFIVASSDADFTPLLQRLRATDRRTMIMACGPSASAYRNVADTILDAEAIVSLIGAHDDVTESLDDTDVQAEPEPGPSADDATRPTGALAAPTPPPAPNQSHQPESGAKTAPGLTGTTQNGATPEPRPAPTTDPMGAQRNRAIMLIRQRLDASDGPLQLSKLGNAIRDALGTDVVESSRWFGRTTLSKFISTNLPDIAVHQQWTWNPAQHAVPKNLAGASKVAAMPEVVGRLHRAAGLPRLPTGHWSALFDTLAAYAATHEFQLTECSKWVRDTMVAKGFPVSRASVNFVLTAMTSSGVRLDTGASPTRPQCRDGLIAAVTARAEATGWELDGRERTALTDWLDAERGGLPPAVSKNE